MVGGQGHLGEALSFVDHDPDPVKGAVFHEFAGHGFGRFQPIRSEVLAEHARRGVHGHDDVDAFAGHVLNAGRTLGPGEHEDDEAEGQRPKSIGH